MLMTLADMSDPRVPRHGRRDRRRQAARGDAGAHPDRRPAGQRACRRRSPGSRPRRARRKARRCSTSRPRSTPPRPTVDPARRLLGERRRDHPGEDGRAAGPRAPGDARQGQGVRSRSRAPRRTPSRRKKEIQVGLSDGLNMEVVAGSRRGRQGRAAAAEGDRVGRHARTGSLRHVPAQLPPPVPARRPRAEAAPLPDRLRHRLGHRGGDPAARLRPGPAQADDGQPEGSGRRHRHRLAVAHQQALAGPAARPADPADRRGHRACCASRCRRSTGISEEYSSGRRTHRYGKKTLAAELSGVERRVRA